MTKLKSKSNEEIESIVLAIWTKVLQTPVLDAGADFYRLGGESLHAVEIISLIEAETGVSFKLGQFMNEPTIGKITEQISLRLAESEKKTA